MSKGCPPKSGTHIIKYISIRINATVLCFICAVRGYPPVHLTYNHRYELLPVLVIKSCAKPF